ncbi:peptide ABC transporter substrate-binding protein [Halarcobacter ebronensis]|uniref:Peptide ABC transporter substrate-binding protein n=1 Tax=Halarcobacter ebronensis TaxID=1462615 RepID=A0A4Q0YC93_9BACT|nr:peptide-binding protein [Halarcobacter ebronensis]RXJ67990.1 peptide ABC transporter substrate-binding protein [Halarcobacter ebronensis]
MKKFIIIISINIFLTLNLYSSTLNLSISSSPSRLNPIIAADSTSSEITQWLFNGLLKYDKDGNIVTDLAKSYYFLNDKKLIIELKKGIKWHDGVELTADDVIFTYEKIMDKNIFTPRKTNYKEVESVKKLDNYTIEVNYKRAYFKALIIWMIEIIPKHILEKQKDLMTSEFNRKPIGTGPYKLAEFKTGSDIELIANENYFEGKPKIEKIHYKFLPDTNTSFLMLKQKLLDIGSLTPLQIDRQIDDEFKDKFKIIERPSFSYDYLGFNLKNKKFQNPKIREALSFAIDRQEMVDILFFGHGKVCTGPFLPGSFAFNEEIKPIKQNLKKAKELLKEAGYDEKHPFSFEIATNAGNETRVNVAQIIQYQLSKIGVKVTIKIMEWQAFLNTIITPKNFEAVVMGWSLALMPDAYPLWHSKSDFLGGFNLVGYHNKKVDELIEKGSEIVDINKLSKIYKELFSLITHDNPYLFLYIPNSISVVNKDIKNIEPSFIGIMHNQIEWIKP